MDPEDQALANMEEKETDAPTTSRQQRQRRHLDNQLQLIKRNRNSSNCTG